MVLRTVLVVLSSLLIGAHFLRHGSQVLPYVCLAAPFLLLIKKRWAPIVLQCFLYVSAALWIFNTRLLVHQRMLEQRPFRGVIIILGAVTLFTVITGLLLNSRAVKDRYAS